MQWTRRDLRTSAILALCCLLIYNANGRAISTGDAFPARYLPFAIWHHHAVTLDPIASLALQGRATRTERPQRTLERAYWTVDAPTGHLVSLYPIVLPVLVAPLYGPAVWFVEARGWTDERVDWVARIMEKLTASSIASLSAALLYLLLRRRAEPRDALLLTAAYAFGTTTWVISSQALWQHGLAQLLIVGLLLVLTGPSTARRALAAGVLCGLIAGNRPRHGAMALVAGAALPVALVLLYNVGIVGAPGGGYGLIGRPAFFDHALLPGIAALLLSPTRGLLVFSPFLVFLALTWRHRAQNRDDRGLALAMWIGIALQVLLYARADWLAGLSWGPRFLTDLLPLLIWLLVPVVAALRGARRTAFVAAVVVAVAIEGVGAFTYTGDSDWRISMAGTTAARHRAGWSWRSAPFLVSARRGLAPAELTMRQRGRVEAIEVDGWQPAAVTAGQHIVVSGWALADRATPLEVAVSLDGAPPVTTRVFVDRPDVRRAIPGAGAAGWSVLLGTVGLEPGEHHVHARVRASTRGQPYLLAPARLTVRSAAADTPVDLASSAATAASRLRAHQQSAGAWLTAFTTTARFHDPQPELNTYLTALLVDLLDPLGRAGDLDDSVRRARQHLTAQIEGDGLVRYHGRPDAPGIGTLGCAITPDTDDTALVWRVAPDPDRARLAGALATIAGYRRPDGLYRTWLAPRDRYRCLDPGRDANPADVAIQMHLLQLLATEQPPAGRALCDALRPRLGDAALWVYYDRSPIVPILRLPDLARAGCAAELPATRLQAAVPGQDVWAAVARHLVRRPLPDDRGADALLRELARDDFARVRRGPPLLYHNDLTASVPRYYWSEDVGYALWLRLADDDAHHRRP
jgi:hypothetical protein